MKPRAARVIHGASLITSRWARSNKATAPGRAGRISQLPLPDTTTCISEAVSQSRHGAHVPSRRHAPQIDRHLQRDSEWLSILGCTLAQAPTMLQLLRDYAMHRCCTALVMGIVCLAATETTHADGVTAPASASELLRELVEINSTHAHGSTEAAKALAAHFLAAGFAAQDVTFLAPADHPSKGNLVVRLRGRGQGRPVLYIGHLDVVEAKPEDWNYDPFKLTEHDGWLYGRGVIDMKGQDVAMAVALMRLKQEGFRPARDLIVAFTADGEAGGDANGVGWLLSTHRELVDAEIVINPDGGEAGVKNGRKLYVAVQTSEKN